MKKITLLLVMLLAVVGVNAEKIVVYDTSTVMGDWTAIGEGTLTPALFSGISAGDKIVVNASESDGGQVWIAKLDGAGWSEVNLLDGVSISTSVSYTLTADDAFIIAERGIRLKGKNFTLSSVEIEKAPQNREGVDLTTIYNTSTEMGDWTAIGEGTLTPALFSGISAGDKIVVNASESDGGQVWIAKLDGDGWSEVNLLDGVSISTSVSYTLTAEDASIIAERGIRLKGKNFTLSSVQIEKPAYVLEEGAYSFSLSSKENVKVTLNRSFAAGWNTLCLPFATTTTALGCKAYEFKSATSTTLTFSEVTELAAGTPYLVDFDEAKSVLSFDKVNVTETEAGSVVKDDITFAGTYIHIDGENKFGVLADGNVKKGAEGAYFDGYRAFFTGALSEARVSIIDDTPTGINDVRSVMFGERGEFFDLQGRSVGQPTKGLYVKNGKKYIVK